jgi:hypothetical protein
MENFEYRFQKRDVIFAKTLRKEENICKIANEKCDFCNENVYLLL